MVWSVPASLFPDFLWWQLLTQAFFPPSSLTSAVKCVTSRVLGVILGRDPLNYPGFWWTSLLQMGHIELHFHHISHNLRWRVMSVLIMWPNNALKCNLNGFSGFLATESSFSKHSSAGPQSQCCPAGCAPAGGGRDHISHSSEQSPLSAELSCISRCADCVRH